jgi:hypothetical protein
VRPRALLLLLPLSACDYALWNWSVTGNHDVIALASGMTLLPLAAVTLGLLCWAALGLAGQLLRRSSASMRSPARHARARRRSATRATRTAQTAEPNAARARAPASPEQPSAPTPRRRIAA